MKMQTKNDIRTKVRLLYGLAYVLREDIDELRIHSADSDIECLQMFVQETTETMEKLINILAEIEYIIFLEQVEEPY